MITDEQAKAAQEIAKASGKAIPLVEAFGGFVAKIIGGPLEQASGIIEDRLKYARWERQQRLMIRATEFLAELGIENTRPLPLNVAVPLLQAASLEEDDELQDVWARLLVNSLDPNSGIELRRAFITILQDFGRTEAKLMQAIVKAPPEAMQHGYVPLAGLPDHYSYLSLEDRRPLPEHIEIAAWNLVRLGCVSPLQTLGALVVSAVTPTALGKALVAACSAGERP